MLHDNMFATYWNKLLDYHPAVGPVIAGLIAVIIGILLLRALMVPGGPPGPIGLPIVGYMAFMNDNSPEVAFQKLSSKYGPVMSVRMGSLQLIVLGSYEAIQEAFVDDGDNFTGKPHENPFRANPDDTGIAYMEGSTWVKHRTFILTTLTFFGMGKLGLETKILDEVDHFLNNLEKNDTLPVDPSDLIEVSFTNVISSVLFGSRYEYDDEELKNLRRLLKDLNSIKRLVALRIFFPWLKFLDKYTARNKFVNLCKQLEDFLQQQIDKHVENYQEGNCNDFIDAFLTERKRALSKRPDSNDFTFKELLGDAGHLLTAGIDKTTSTLRWAILFFILNPDVQKTVQLEIGEVIGSERDPQMADLKKMPYTEATILEIHRCGSVSPLTLFRSNYEESHILGHTIPKRSHCIANLWSVHMDPKLWSNPEVFDPRRHINPEDNSIKCDYLLPFGAGKRDCVGKSLAQMEIFLYIAKMLQRFELCKASDDEVLNLDYDIGITRAPKPFKMRVFERMR